ncbi:MAG: DUF3137 domain-containing protein [Saprospiraceae bacterium]
MTNRTELLEKVRLGSLEKARPQIMDLEKQRRFLIKQHYRKVIISLSALGAAVVWIILCVSILGILSVKVALFGVLAAVVYTGIHMEKQRKPLERQLRQTIGKAMIGLFDPQWDYAAEQHLPARHFRHLGITRRFDKVEGENLIHGKHGDTEFSFSHLRLLRQNDSNQKVFEGLIVVADFHKDIKGKTLVLPNLVQQSFGSWLGKKINEFGRHGLDLVSLEDPFFEKAFVVYSSDQIEARYILTPAMMARLVELNNKYDNNLSFSFTHGKVCIAIKDVRPFETSLHMPVTPDLLFNQFGRPIEAVTEIIDILNLNTRIWTKGEDD